MHPGIDPIDLALVAVEASQFTVEGHHQQPVAPLRHSRNAVVRAELISPVAYLDLHKLLVALAIGMVAIDAILKVLHPDSPLRVNIHPLDITVKAHLGERPGRIAFEGLRHGVIDAIAHALPHPQLAVGSLIDAVAIAVSHRRGVTWVREESLHPVAVIAVQTVWGTDPHKPTGVLVYIIDLRTRQALGCIQPTELHVGNQGRLSRHTEADGQQTQGYQFLHIIHRFICLVLFSAYLQTRNISANTST